jgi:hypothetical protein
MWSAAVAGDSGNSARIVRNGLYEWAIEAVIPEQADESASRVYARDAGEAGHDRVNKPRLKRHRRIATRSDKLTSDFLAVVMIDALLDGL